MASDLRISWRFYAAVAAVAGALALVAALVLRAPSPKPASSVAGAGGRPAPIAFEPLSGATGDEALLRDPTPLFLPTRWNAAQGVRPDRALREPGEAFAGFGAKFVFGENQAELALPSVVVVPEHPAAAIRPSDWQAPFLGLGRTDAMVVPCRRGRPGWRCGFAAMAGRSSNRSWRRSSRSGRRTGSLWSLGWPWRLGERSGRPRW